MTTSARNSALQVVVALAYARPTQLHANPFGGRGSMQILGISTRSDLARFPVRQLGF